MRPWANCGDWTDIFVERTDIFAANESERLFLRGGCVQTVAKWCSDAFNSLREPTVLIDH